MVEFNTLILKFAGKGEKTGWTYIEIPSDIAGQLMPGNKKSFRVRGMLDALPVDGLALMPMGEGNFILALRAGIRKGIRKSEGAVIKVCLEHDPDYTVEIPEELQECFEDEPQAFAFYNSLAKGHRDYFVKWINQAKTEPTRLRRIVSTVHAIGNGMDFGQMMRAIKKGK